MEVLLVWLGCGSVKWFAGRVLLIGLVTNFEKGKLYTCIRHHASSLQHPVGLTLSHAPTFPFVWKLLHTKFLRTKHHIISSHITKPQDKQQALDCSPPAGAHALMTS